MRIQHNIAAMNANRMLGKTVSAQSKATQQLSSGYRINSAADDAAGLTISEKMRNQISGLNKAVTNAKDGISLIQTAEGALAEDQALLQRMRELAVQASNGTLTDDDRTAIQTEIEQIQEEITRTSETTEFNTMKLLDGSLAEKKQDIKYSSSQPGAFNIRDGVAGKYKLTLAKIDAGKNMKVSSDAWNGDDKINFKVGYTDAEGNSKELTISFTLMRDSATSSTGKLIAESGTAYTANTVGTVKAAGGTIQQGEITAAELSNAVLAELKKSELAKDFKISTDQQATGKFTFEAKAPGKNQPMITSISVGQVKDGSHLAEVDSVAAKANPLAENDIVYMDAKQQNAYTGAKTEDVKDHIFEVEGQKFLFATTAGVASLSKGDYADVNIVQVADKNMLNVTDPEVEQMAKLISQRTGANAYTIADTANTTDDFNKEALGKRIVIKPGSQVENKGIELQIGANEGQSIEFKIENMSASALGVDKDDIDLSTQDSAKKALGVIDKAVSLVSRQRSILGAVQNRLEHTISNLEVTSENTQNAESLIRDTDMASVMVQFSKNQILQQAGQAMLTQANQSNQGVLSLIQ